MTLIAGNSETITLDVMPYDDTTDVSVILYSPTGVVIDLLEPIETTEVGAGAAAYLHAEAVAGYDEPGNWLQLWTVTGTGAGVVARHILIDPVPVRPEVTWPPSLVDLKYDLGIRADDTDQDLSLAKQLAAAIEWVSHTAPTSDLYNFDDESDSELPDPTTTIALGTIRLVGRWQSRKRSPDGLVNMDSLGTSRVASYDPDIDRMLHLGRYAPPAIA